MKFNEDSRVKIPTILHLIRLGYNYLSLKNQQWDESTNIFIDIFNESIQKINPDLTPNDIKKLYNEISVYLENEDVGRAFYEKLIDQSGVKLIDFENFDKNTFNVVTELPYKKDDEEFRPDIVILINGIPLSFIEVKKPNNKDGIIAEHERIEKRFKNKKFRKFVNITQFMVFSNNMKYDDTSILQIQGAFYSSTSYKKPIFNYFREEESFDFNNILIDIDDKKENFILKDNNLLSIKNSNEYITNKDPKRPTNTICTSLYQRQRFKFILQYSIAYVNESGGLEKHIMRYPQIFATKAIEKTLDKDIKKGIIWHTQGSGKTALAYYNVKFLTDYYQNKGIISKFYFIVDRLDLLIQASREFKARGLAVHHISSREDFAKDIKSSKAIHNDSGKPEITVVNIQKFKDDPDVIKNNDYNLNIQRIFFLDEVHRSYNPKGSFLANLQQSDKHSIKIGLTGTPLLGNDYNSKSLFGGYIHKYYYNASIKDGYTLRLIREEIETSYKLKMKKALKEIQVLKGNVERKQLYSHHKFAEPMLDYIIEDFNQSKIAMNDDTIGGMVVCDTSDQAKILYELFQKKYASDNTAKLILHDVDTKKDRKDYVEDFKEGKIDLLFVYNMLLTGFDSRRLKKMYLGRVIKAHNLLQALTRVNRTYKEFQYGYVVDFADIEKEFEKTNRNYLNELQSELGDEMEHYADMFKSNEEIDLEIQEIKSVLFYFDTQNAEEFSKQINQIDDRKEMIKITRVLNNARALYNIIRYSGKYELLDKLDFKKLTILSREANNRLSLINTKELIENNIDTANLLNVALEDVIFAFSKIKEEEMVLADQLKNTLQKTREMLGGNFDPKDPHFITLKEELERLFKKKNLSEVTKEEMESNIKDLETIYDNAKELERKNQLLKAKYDNDAKYARLHKRLTEKDPLTDNEMKLFEALQSLKEEIDKQVLQNSNMLDNESYIERMMMRIIVEQIKNKHNINLDASSAKRINGLIVKEYINEYNGVAA